MKLSFLSRSLKTVSSRFCLVKAVLIVLASTVSCSVTSSTLSANTPTKNQHTTTHHASNLHVSIAQYHHVANNTPAVTSISPEQFKAHMEYLDEFHTVVSLDKVVSAFKNKTPLPENAVAITFDDGYQNILQNAHPILLKHNFPYTIFINPAEIGGSSAQLDWDEVVGMSKQNVTFANHTLDHAHLLTRYPRETEKDWKKRVARDITMAEGLIEERVGYSKKWLAYPFGEFDIALQGLLNELGYIGFGQQSGAAAWYSNQLALPRFPAAGRYANLDTLITKMQSLAMPVVKVSPLDTKVLPSEAPGKVTLSIKTNDMHPNQFACYFKGDKLDVQFKPLSPQQQTALSHPLMVSDAQQVVTEFSFEINQTFAPGRSRVNCTAQSKALKGRFYWYSLPWFTPTEDGEYLD